MSDTHRQDADAWEASWGVYLVLLGSSPSEEELRAHGEGLAVASLWVVKALTRNA